MLRQEQDGVMVSAVPGEITAVNFQNDIPVPSIRRLVILAKIPYVIGNMVK